MRLFRVTLYDKVREGKRTVQFYSYLVTADNEYQAVRVLREERPGAFRLVQAIHVRGEAANGEVWLLFAGTLSRQRAEVVYKLANFPCANPQLESE